MSLSDMKLLGDRVVVRRLPPTGGIIKLTDEDLHPIAVVLNVGPGRWRKDGTRLAMTVKKDDIVLVPGVANKFPDYREGEELLITEADIGGILLPDEAS